jgi:hypothetical protein
MEVIFIPLVQAGYLSRSKLVLATDERTRQHVVAIRQNA